MIWLPRMLASLWTWALLYLLMVCLIAGALLVYRPILLRKFAQPKVTQSWDSWREDAKRSSGKDGRLVEGPVQRKVPKSAEPPGAILLRDYFPTVLAASLFFPSLLFVFTAFAIRGMAREMLVRKAASA